MSEKFRKQAFSMIIFVILFSIFILILSTCQSHSEPVPRKWTVMVYMAADNNLESAAIEDINEMEASHIDNSGMDVIVLFDRTPGYNTTNGDWTDTRLYKIKHDIISFDNIIVSTRLASSELGLTTTTATELNMGDPATCSNFIDFCKTNYPSEYYFLIYWNHGSGWMKKSISEDDQDYPGVTKAVCNDDSSVDDYSTSAPPYNYARLYTKEIGDAIADKNITIVGFDVCLAGMFEIAYEIRNDAAYMIASEETEDVNGWAYDDWINDFASYSALNQTPENLIKAVVDTYEDEYRRYTGMTLSGIDLSKIDALNTALDSFSLAVYNNITSGNRIEVRNRLYYNVESIKSNDINLDIWDMAYVIKSNYSFADTQADGLMTAVDDAVVYEWHNTTTGSDGNPYVHGIALHYCSIAYGNIVNEYWKGFDSGEGWLYPLQFVTDSAWVPVYSSGPGLLYRLWFESL